MDPVSLIQKTEELIAWAKKLRGPENGGSGDGLDRPDFEKFRVASLDFIGLLFEPTHSRCRTFEGQAGRASLDSIREDLAVLETLRNELLYSRDFGS